MPGVKSTICELGCPDHNGIRQLAQSANPRSDPNSKCEELNGEAAVGGLATADTAFSVADEATKGLRAPPGVDLPAIRFVGGLTSFAGAAFTVRSAVQNYQQGNYSGLALNALDLTVTGVGVVFPELAPAVILYGAARTGWDIGSTLGQARRLGCH